MSINENSGPLFGHVSDVMGYFDRAKASEGFVNNVRSNRKPHLIARLKYLMSLLEKFDRLGRRRSKVQKMIHEYMVAAMLHVIFPGDDLPNHLAEIASIMKIESVIKTLLFILLSRRSGKTNAVAMFAAAIALALPNSRGNIYSTGERVSRLLGEQILEYIKMLEPNIKIVKSAGEVIEIKTEDGNSRYISCFPASEEVSPFFSLCVCVCFLGGLSAEHTPVPLKIRTKSG